MNRSVYQRAIRISALLMLAVPFHSVQAQPRNSNVASHGPIPGVGKMDATTALGKFLEQRRDLTQSQDLLKDPGRMQKILQELQKDPEALSALQKLVQAYQDRQIDLKSSPEALKQFEEYITSKDADKLPDLREKLRKIVDENKADPGMGQANQTKGTDGTPPGQQSENNDNTDSGDSPAPTNVPETGSMEAAPEDPFANSRLAKWLLKQTADSPELRGIVEDMLRYQSQMMSLGPLKSLSDTFGDKILRKVGDALPESRIWQEGILPKLQKIRLPSLPEVHVPDVHMPAPALPSLHLPVFGPITPGGWGGGTLWLSLTAFVLIALLGWRIYRQRQATAKVTSVNGETWVLGPWPVAPSAIASKEDLVRAFEYLTLLQLGIEARSWNHHMVAEELSGDQIARRRAAEHLASIYERARYAPVQEPLPPEAFSAARRELAFLAEGASA